MQLPSTVTIGAGVLSRTGFAIKVRYSAPFRIRVWLAVQLVRVAGWLMGGTVDAQQETPNA